SPAGIDDFAHVSLVIAVGIFQKQKVRGLRHNESAVYRRYTGGNIQTIGEHRAVVCTAITVSVFTHTDSVVAFAVREKLIGVIHRLHHKQASALIPGKGDWVDNIRLGYKQL